MRLLLETSAFGPLAEDPRIDEITDKIKSSSKFTICKFDVIRNELRGKKDSSRYGKGKYAKVVLTTFYDKFTSGKDYRENKKIKELAEAYYKEYKKNGGGQAKRKIMNDFKIIACAALGGMDVVVSIDNRTMFSEIARKSYVQVNDSRGIRTPGFWDYKRFRKAVLGS